MRNGNVLLTGSSGFVGTHILIELQRGLCCTRNFKNLDREKTF